MGTRVLRRRPATKHHGQRPGAAPAHSPVYSGTAEWRRDSQESSSPGSHQTSEGARMAGAVAVSVHCTQRAPRCLWPRRSAVGYCLTMAMCTRSSGLIKWSWLSAPMSPTKLTADRQELLRRLAVTGEPVAELAKAFGVSRATAYRYLSQSPMGGRAMTDDLHRSIYLRAAA